MLLSVLKLVTMQRQGGLPPPMPMTGFPLPAEAPPTRVSPLMFPPGAGPAHLSISPGPPQARVPSPQEMTVLTQQIMQQALIKRKLEEQKENYRKRHGGPEPNIAAMLASAATGQPPSSSMPSASPLAFTPTSVMRKKIAERKDSDPQVQAVPELKITAGREQMTQEELANPKPTSPGRAITKSKEERPGSLELCGQQQQQSAQPRRPSPHQMFPPQMPLNNPMMYLQNNPLGPVSHSMLSKYLVYRYLLSR